MSKTVIDVKTKGGRVGIELRAVVYKRQEQYNAKEAVKA